MNGLLLAAVVTASACFIVEGVHSQTCGETYNPPNHTNFDPSMLHGTWFGMNQTEQTHITDCYYITLTPSAGSNNTRVDFGGWYFVRFFQNVTFSVPNVTTTEDDTLCAMDNTDRDRITLKGNGNVTVHKFLGFPYLWDEGFTQPFELKFQVFQLDPCGFMNVRFCYALPNLFVTNNYVVLVRDPRNVTAWSTAFELMKKNRPTDFPKMYSINNTYCEF